MTYVTFVNAVIIKTERGAVLDNLIMRYLIFNSSVTGSTNLKSVPMVSSFVKRVKATRGYTKDYVGNNQKNRYLLKISF